MADRPFGPRYPFSGARPDRWQSNYNSQNTSHSHGRPAPYLGDASNPFSPASTPQHLAYNSATTPANRQQQQQQQQQQQPVQQPYDIGRDELVARFLGWEVTQDVRANLADQEKRQKHLSNNWFSMCESLEKDYASKSEACRKNNYDKVWCPMKLKNYFDFIKQETKTHYPEEFTKIAWNKKMDAHIKTIMVSQVAHKGASLLGCIAILKSSLGPPAPNQKQQQQQNYPQMSTPPYASYDQQSIWGPPSATPYTRYPTNPGPPQKQWPK
ncbi:uncharacterized protein TRUGW13939_10457 [Talaromyces rugulosus]|uniref:Uncharacterized protein n=1 Tax=Talaromyces rugulosus TaxID=121627 RepID=A0A7H8RBA0_TALRU|nr:uncharacterized protein TRUGW13939_10457 [Talaromyces rugulosus]QKX63288.1 hypothetical protein TRUGW13939_10457 [Talaromyces rugulosus]